MQSRMRKLLQKVDAQQDAEPFLLPVTEVRACADAACRIAERREHTRCCVATCGAGRAAGIDDGNDRWGRQRQAPNYLSIISKPMSLLVIRRKLLKVCPPFPLDGFHIAACLLWWNERCRTFVCGVASDLRHDFVCAASVRIGGFIPGRLRSHVQQRHHVQRRGMEAVEPCNVQYAMTISWLPPQESPVYECTVRLRDFVSRCDPAGTRRLSNTK